MENLFTQLGLRPFAGQYGKAETEFALTKKKILLHSPEEVVYLALACSFLRYWSGLQEEEKQGRAGKWC